MDVLLKKKNGKVVNPVKREGEEEVYETTYGNTYEAKKKVEEALRKLRESEGDYDEEFEGMETKLVPKDSPEEKAKKFPKLNKKYLK